MEKRPDSDQLDRALTDLYRTDIPEGYRAGWREAVAREELAQMKHPSAPKRKTLWRVALPIAAALVLTLGAIGAGNLIPTVVNDTLHSAPLPSMTWSSPEQFAAQSEYGYSDSDTASRSIVAMAPAPGAGSPAGGAAEANDSMADTAAKGTDQPATQSKIVRTADLTIATTAFDEDSAAVLSLTDRLGGYVASASQYGEASARKDRVAYYTLRIPSDKLGDFLNGLAGIGRITARNETATDMTTEYSDTTLRLTTQQQKMARLQELLKQASDVSDLLEIESEIADTQYALDSLESSLRTIDRDVDRSAVTITLQEQSPEDTAQAVELTLWQRIGSGFEASVRGLAAFGQNLLVFLAMLLPALVPLALLVAILWACLRAWRKRHPREGHSETPADARAPETPAATANPDGTPEAK